eukprot:gene16803-22285_t
MSENNNTKEVNDVNLPKFEDIKNSILKKLIDSGEKDRLKELLSERLIQSGWRDQLKEHCKDIIRKKGLEKVSVEELVSEITPQGRATIPSDIKVELLERIRLFLNSTANDEDKIDPIDPSEIDL